MEGKKAMAVAVKLVAKIGDKEVELTREEAVILKAELEKFLGSYEPVLVPFVQIPYGYGGSTGEEPWSIVTTVSGAPDEIQNDCCGSR